MKELKILYLYPDMLELYGDYGNIQVLKYRLEKRGFNCIVDRYSIGDEKPDFKSYDIIFAGGGADNELFGKYYKGVEGNIIPGLEIFPYYTEAISDRKKRCIGNIVLNVNLNGQETKVIGFENHGGQTYDIPTPFGKVLFGNGNKFGDTEEGFFKENVIATYLHGPLLSKNPEVTDYMIKHCLDRKYQEDIVLEPLNDEFENLCRKQLLDRFLNTHN